MRIVFSVIVSAFWLRMGGILMVDGSIAGLCLGANLLLAMRNVQEVRRRRKDIEILDWPQTRVALSMSGIRIRWGPLVVEQMHGAGSLKSTVLQGLSNINYGHWTEPLTYS